MNYKEKLMDEAVGFNKMANYKQKSEQTFKRLEEMCKCVNLQGFNPYGEYMESGLFIKILEIVNKEMRE